MRRRVQLCLFSLLVLLYYIGQFKLVTEIYLLQNVNCCVCESVKKVAKNLFRRYCTQMPLLAHQRAESLLIALMPIFIALWQRCRVSRYTDIYLPEYTASRTRTPWSFLSLFTSIICLISYQSHDEGYF
jgi:hypothetical protein